MYWGEFVRNAQTVDTGIGVGAIGFMYWAVVCCLYHICEGTGNPPRGGGGGGGQGGGWVSFLWGWGGGGG